MKTHDARKLPDEVLEEKRRLAVRLRKRGMTREAIGELVEAHADTVGRWLKNYADTGAAGLKAKRRGRREGEGRQLGAEQEAQLCKLLIDKTPDQLKLSYALWTRKAVKELIQARWGVNMPIRTVGEYLKRWGFTPQKPVKRAYEQRPEAVERWLKEAYPAIQAKAREERRRFTGVTRRACAMTASMNVVMPRRASPRWCGSTPSGSRST